MRSSKYLLFLLLILSLIFLATCEVDWENADHNPPAEVHGLRIVHGDNEISLSWKDPRNFDFNSIEVECDGQFYPVKKGIGELTIDSLSNNITYDVYVRTLDYSKNKSPGTLIIGKPLTPPHLQWGPPATYDILYNPQGYPNGSFTLQRDFINTGNAGYITFQIYAIDLTNNDTIESDKTVLLLAPSASYTLHFTSNGDLSAFNCTTCDTSDVNYQIEFISEHDGETFFADLVSCQITDSCNNGMNNRRIRWNDIWVRDFYLERTDDK